MGMSEKEWQNLSRERGLDSATGKKLEPTESAHSAEFDIETHTLLRHIRDELKMLVTLSAIGFTVLAILIVWRLA